MGYQLVPNRHFYLYAKRWYHTNDTLDDLKIIMSNYSGVNKKHLSFYNVVTYLLSLLKKHNLVTKFVDNIIHDYFKSDCIIKNIFNDLNEVNIKTLILNEILSQLTLLTVDDILKVEHGILGEADKSILPLNTKGLFSNYSNEDEDIKDFEKSINDFEEENDDDDDEEDEDEDIIF